VTRQWLVAEPSPTLDSLLRDVFGRLAAGLPEPR